jgi:integrase
MPAGVEGLRFHDLRHSAATLAPAAGANTRELVERMGTPPRRWRCATNM